MKNVNPLGRKPSIEKMSAYGCMCNVAIGLAIIVKCFP